MGRRWPTCRELKQAMTIPGQAPRSPRFINTAAAMAVAVLMVAGCASAANGPVEVASEVAAATPASPSPVTAAPQNAAAGFPSFVAPTVDGGQIDFASLEGQDTVLWFWAPW